MVVVERELSGFELPANAPAAGSTVTSFTLVTSPKAPYKDFTYTLSFPLSNAVRTTLVGPNWPLPPQDNVVLKTAPLEFKIVSLDASACTAVLAFPEAQGDLDPNPPRREVRLQWADSIISEIWEGGAADTMTRLCGDLPARSYALTEHGVMRHWWIERNNLHLGLGEKAAPLDLTGRRFHIHGTDAACYDTYEGDPLYKHTPFLISTPRSTVEPTGDGQWKPRGSSYALYHATNSAGTWDVGRTHDDPWGYFKTYTQDHGGLDEWCLIGEGVQQVTRTFAEVVGRPLLVGRDWLGYLASGMGLGESDEPPAQELLATWPDLCKKYDIPCSAIHFSSGYTVSEEGNRNVFTMNTSRYPDFKGLVAGLHKAGIKVVPNIKPYMLQSHPQYSTVSETDAIFHDPSINEPVVTRIWSAGIGQNGKGSWVDMTSPEGRQWWANGVKSLIELGVDGMWNDNNEYYLHDDGFLARNEFPHEFSTPAPKGKATVGLLGRMINTEMVGKVSHDELLAANPERRPYVLTRSANVGAFKYVCSTWTGDNETSWKNLRGSQAIQVNSGISLMQSTGSDIGGFGGPVPSPELFARWVQLGVTHHRFCIHAFKPTADDPSGASTTNMPWMHGGVLPAIRDAIKWRYAHLPFFNHLMWRSHLHAEPTTTWLGWGAFQSDPELYTAKVLEGFDTWIGTGQLLSAPSMHEGEFTRTVYLPKASADDKSLYFDLHAPYGKYEAGNWVTIATPLEHNGLLAREGALIPVGKDYHTTTQREGPARTTTDGVDILLEEDGGVVGLDDFRGALIFPGKEAKSYEGEWIEDDGISSNPDRTVVGVQYESVPEESSVRVIAKFKQNDFKTLWGDSLWVFLPVGDGRVVVGKDAKKGVAPNGREGWSIKVEA